MEAGAFNCRISFDRWAPLSEFHSSFQAWLTLTDPVSDFLTVRNCPVIRELLYKNAVGVETSLPIHWSWWASPPHHSYEEIIRPRSATCPPACHIRRGSMKFGARAFSFFLDLTPHLTQFDSWLEYDGTTLSGSDSWTQAPIPIHHNRLTRAPTIPVTSFPAAGHPRQPNP